MVASAVVSEIDERNREFERAFNSRMFAQLADLYAEGARVLPPGAALTRGRDAIQEFWEAAHASGISRIQLHTDSVEAAGDTAYEVSTATLGLESGESQVVKYVVIWTREPGGPWQLAVDIWNS